MGNNDTTPSEPDSRTLLKQCENFQLSYINSVAKIYTHKESTLTKYVKSFARHRCDVFRTDLINRRECAADRATLDKRVWLKN